RGQRAGVVDPFRRAEDEVAAKTRAISSLAWFNHSWAHGVAVPLARSGGERYAEGVDRDEMLRVLRAFADEELEYVLVGAAAMGVHGIVRATEDLDIFIRATRENVTRLQRAFRAVYGGDPNI